MALIGQGVLIIWHAMTPEGDLEMIRWHDREHVAERVGIPGFLRGRRYDSADRDPRVPRHLRDRERGDGPERAVHPAAQLPDRVDEARPASLPEHRAPRLPDRADDGPRPGRGTPDAPRPTRHRGATTPSSAGSGRRAPPRCSTRPVSSGVHLLRTVPAMTQVKTDEGKLKGGEVAKGEEPWPWVLLVETGGIEFAEGDRGPLFQAGRPRGPRRGRRCGPRPRTGSSSRWTRHSGLARSSSCR